MKPVLVIGATGNIGNEVVAQLAARAVPVRAMTRGPQAAGLPPQVEVMEGDLVLPDTLDTCLEDIETVFLVWTAPPTAVSAAIERIAKHARRIVFLSAPIKTPHPFFQQPNPQRVMVEEIERRIEASELEWTFLRPGMLAMNALGWWAPQIRSGDVVRGVHANVPTAPIHEKDVAAVAVRTLCESGHAGAEYVLTGPQSLTHAEQVSTIGYAIGRTLRFEEVSPEEWRRTCVPVWPPMITDMLLKAWAAAVGHPAFVTSTVEELTGSTARTFFDWAAEHTAEFRPDVG